MFVQMYQLTSISRPDYTGTCYSRIMLRNIAEHLHFGSKIPTNNNLAWHQKFDDIGNSTIQNKRTAQLKLRSFDHIFIAFRFDSVIPITCCISNAFSMYCSDIKFIYVFPNHFDTKLSSASQNITSATVQICDNDN